MKTEQPVSKRTMQLHLHKNGFVRRVAKKKLVIRENNRKKTLVMVQRKEKIDYWRKVIFSDESKIVIGQNSRVYIWRKRGKGWRPDLVEARRAKPSYEVMIWGCISWHGVGTITAVNGNINAEKYQQVLNDDLWPVIVRHFSNEQYIFQDDNAPVHRARSMQDFIHRNGIRTMSWPAQSPHLNIIENLWLLLKRKLQARVSCIENKDDLFR